MGAVGGEGLPPGFGAGGGGGRGTVVGREGAVLIRCDRSSTEEVMWARDADISSLLGTVFATELTESEQEKGNPNPLIYLLSLHETLLIPKETSRIHQFIQDYSRTWIGNLTN